MVIPHPGTHEEPATELETTNTEEPLTTVTPSVESTEETRPVSMEAPQGSRGTS